MNNKSLLKEIDEKFSTLHQEKTQLEKRISDITVEIFRLQGEARLLEKLEGEKKEVKK